MCFWEDDGSQLRWPLSADGANGVSLQDAQRTYQRIGAMHTDFRGKVRSARRDEPLDPGWRPFDPARDWTSPDLDGSRWPKNLHALYWWRPTYWNGDPDALPADPVEPGPEDRLLERLRRHVPETHPVVEALEWQYGSAHPFEVFAQAAEIAIGAYRAGDRELGDRIVRVMNDGLTVEETAAGNGVVIGFLENEGWHTPELHDAIEAWPREIRAEIRSQQQWMARADAEARAWQHPYLTISEALVDLARTHRGRSLSVSAPALQASLEAHQVHLPEPQVRELAAMATQRGWRWRHPVRYLRTRRLRHLRFAG